MRAGKLSSSLVPARCPAHLLKNLDLHERGKRRRHTRAKQAAQPQLPEQVKVSSAGVLHLHHRTRHNALGKGKSESTTRLCLNLVQVTQLGRGRADLEAKDQGLTEMRQTEREQLVLEGGRDQLEVVKVRQQIA